MEKRRRVNRRRGGKTILKSEQGWTLPPQLNEDKRLLGSHLWCPNDLERLWDRLD